MSEVDEPTTLASTIRGLDTQGLSRLLTLRPDLANPTPRDLTEVSSRAGTHASITAAISSLDRWRLSLLTALAALGDLTLADLADAICQGWPTKPDTIRADVAAGVSDLLDMALVLEDSDHLHVIQVVTTHLSGYPAGLAPASVMPMSSTEVAEALAAAGPQARAVVERLMWSPTGHVPHARRTVTPETATTPVETALAHHLLRPLDDDTVVLPREVALVLRGNRLFAEQPQPTPPAWPEPSQTTLVNRAGLGTALEAVSAMSALLEGVERHDCALLANGGIAKRDARAVLSRVAAEDDGWVYLALAAAGGLIGADGRGWLPTPLADRWRTDSLWGQWVSLRDAWRRIPQPPGNLDNTLVASAPATARAWRRLVHQELSSAEPGTPVEASLVADRIRWRQPGTAVEDSLVEAVLDECRVLGMIALGARTDLVDSLTCADMPERTDEVILQSDLTAVAPGPLTPSTAADLALLADRESTGIAGVRRFSRASLRRALDAGWTGERVRQWWSEHSLSEVPQGLLVLLDDVVRDHGRVSVAAAGALLEVDDPAAVEAIMRSSLAKDLALRRVGAQVLVAQAEPDQVLAGLRQLGMAPVARDSHGDVFSAPPPPRAKIDVSPASAPQTDPEGLAASLLKNKGRGFSDRRQLLAHLHQAQQEGMWMQIERVIDDGTAVRQTVRIMAVAAGAVRCVIRGGGGVLIVPVSRITACQPA
ncbi:helicase-associated domain-containing protein [Cutibacterium sp.]|uniref:helicase-associated domain-containing protein n=1 Tax=Cutibacterium sp. TaxID=1912221 RepID=UPI0026DCFA5A|nr:helicase-associated domain-containing protein [Cutibacterium sp.]MDO4412910.1 helicase-associated domain-containing protein [Cutibacterium sp.]